MAVKNVKITELDPVTFLKENDLFLIANPLYNSDGSIIANNRYTSNSLSGGALKKSFENYELSVESTWRFKGGPEHIPEQTTKLEISGFVEALKDPDYLSSIADDSLPGGWYAGLSSSVVQHGENDGVVDSLSTPNSGIPNIDFVERAIAGAYQSILDQFKNIVTSSGDSHFIPSHVGEIVYSTTLAPKPSVPGWKSGETINQSDNNQDAELKKRYGYGQNIDGVQYPNTKWIQHSGYFLRGAPTGVISASTSTGLGGSDKKTLTVPNLPAHNHTATFAGTGSNGSTGKITVKGNIPYVIGTAADAHQQGNPGTSSCYPGGTTSVTLTGNGVNVTVTPTGTVSVNDTGSGTPFDIVPLYKNVYIWERIQ